MQRNGSNRS